jgi:hypothetical protein
MEDDGAYPRNSVVQWRPHLIFIPFRALPVFVWRESRGGKLLGSYRSQEVASLRGLFLWYVNRRSIASSRCGIPISIVLI